VADVCNQYGYLIPDKSYLVENSEDKYEGAIVFEPKIGLYIDMPVSVLDYASLYPSSMISENISHDTIINEDEVEYYEE
jgi:DNA polymerase elongation subunit (family B)